MHWQQVINTIKSKHYSYNTIDTGTGSVTALNVIKQNRNARRLSLSPGLEEELLPRGLRAVDVLQAVGRLKD